MTDRDYEHIQPYRWSYEGTEDGESVFRIECPQCHDTVGNGGECSCGFQWNVTVEGIREFPITLRSPAPR